MRRMISTRARSHLVRFLFQPLLLDAFVLNVRVQCGVAVSSWVVCERVCVCVCGWV